MTEEMKKEWQNELDITDKTPATYAKLKRKMPDEWKLIAAVILGILFFTFAVRLMNKDRKPDVKLISYYPESVTVEQGKQKMVVDGLQMTQFVLSGVRIIVNGDTLRNVNCEMIKH